MAKKILYLDWPCFGKEDILETFSDFGFQTVPFFHENYTERKDASFDSAFDKAAADDFSFCFSFNYYPLVSEGCKRRGIPYISVIYDSPQVAVYSYTIINPNNYVFIFDSELYTRLQKEGIQTEAHCAHLKDNARKHGPIPVRRFLHRLSLPRGSQLLRPVERRQRIYGRLS